MSQLQAITILSTHSLESRIPPAAGHSPFSMTEAKEAQFSGQEKSKS